MGKKREKPIKVYCSNCSTELMLWLYNKNTAVQKCRYCGVKIKLTFISRRCMQIDYHTPKEKYFIQNN